MRKMKKKIIDDRNFNSQYAKLVLVQEPYNFSVFNEHSILKNRLWNISIFLITPPLLQKNFQPSPKIQALNSNSICFYSTFVFVQGLVNLIGDGAMTFF